MAGDSLSPSYCSSNCVAVATKTSRGEISPVHNLSADFSVYNYFLLLVIHLHYPQVSEEDSALREKYLLSIHAMKD